MGPRAACAGRSTRSKDFQQTTRPSHPARVARNVNACLAGSGNRTRKPGYLEFASLGLGLGVPNPEKFGGTILSKFGRSPPIPRRSGSLEPDPKTSYGRQWSWVWLWGLSYSLLPDRQRGHQRGSVTRVLVYQGGFTFPRRSDEMLGRGPRSKPRAPTQRSAALSSAV